MQPTTTSMAASAIGRTDRPPVSPLSQLVAKVLTAPPAAAAKPAAAVEPTKEQPPVRADGRNIRLGSLVDIRI